MLRNRFAAAYCQAVKGALSHWAVSAEGALALALLLDQYPRNSFRGTLWVYATDPMARLVSEQALALGHLGRFPPDLGTFLLLPFGHLERLEDQERSVRLAEAFLPDGVGDTRHHRDLIRRFGHFRTATPFWGAPRRPRRRSTSPRAVMLADPCKPGVRTPNDRARSADEQRKGGVAFIGGRYILCTCALPGGGTLRAPRLAARRLWPRAQRLDTDTLFGSGPEATRAAIEHLGYVQIDHHVLWTALQSTPVRQRPRAHRCS